MSLNADFDVIPLPVAEGSFVAPYAAEIVKVLVKGATGGSETVVKVNDTEIHKFDLTDGNGSVESSIPVQRSSKGFNQPNDTGLGYQNVIEPSVGNPVPVAILNTGDVVSVSTGGATAGAVSLVLQKK